MHIRNFILQSTSYTNHDKQLILHIAFYILYLTHSILHIAYYTLQIKHYILHIASYTLYFTYCILHIASNTLHFTYCKYKNLRNIKSLQCPQWPLPRKGRPLLMTRRNDRTLSPLHLMHCVILHLGHYTLNLIHCIFHITHSILHITSYALYLSHWILHIASYILHLTRKKWEFQKIENHWSNTTWTMSMKMTWENRNKKKQLS